jgi:aryl-alcohol dehydrogenase-like predicted oxidoreductase
VEYRRLGRTERRVSAIGFGAWAIGGDWGPVDDADSLRALHAAADAGVTLFDTADVYGDGRSERVIGQFLRERRGESLFVATKMGRRAPLDPVHYTPEAFRDWVDRSRDNLGVDRLDLVQLHTLPTAIYYRPEIFAALDDLVSAGAISSYGVSVERVEEGLKAIEFPGVAVVQIVYNIVRQRPAERFLAEAALRDVGVLARIPLASGLLTGKLTKETVFDESDHRRFNREGAAFDRGETFAGVDYETGLGVVEELRSLVPTGATLAQMALRWVLMSDAVTATIPGAKTPEQARANAGAVDLAPLPPAAMERIAALYEERVKPLVHQRW